jgi:hypothetical protein
MTCWRSNLCGPCSRKVSGCTAVLVSGGLMTAPSTEPAGMLGGSPEHCASGVTPTPRSRNCLFANPNITAMMEIWKLWTPSRSSPLSRRTRA